MCFGDGSEVCEWSLFSGDGDGVGEEFIDWAIVV